MLRDLFINTTILISFISLASQLFRKYELNLSNSIKHRIIIGLLTGSLGVLLMLFSVRIYDKTILDFRIIAIVMSSVFGGVLPAIICGSIIALFRVIYFGFNLSSIFGVVIVIVSTIGCIFISKIHIRASRKWIYSILFSLAFSSIIFTILLEGKINLQDFLSTYWVTTLIVSVIIYYYVRYSLAANALFRKLQEESSKDFLTGLNNVRQFDTLFNSASKNASEKNENLTLLMIDIDFFKKVNDTYGHQNGDIVLIELGKVLTSSSRSFDIVSRNGGEEFTVLLLDCPYSYALQIAERIRANVEAHTFILSNGTKIKITVSIGVASYPETVTDLDKLLEKSDMALYTAKRTGRNKVCSVK